MEAGLLGLAAALRAAGVPADAARARTFVEAVGHVGVGDRSAVYWAGRACLCSAPDQQRLYDAVFDAWFTALVVPEQVSDALTSVQPSPAGGPEVTVGSTSAGLAVTDPELPEQVGQGPQADRGELRIGARAGAGERLRHRDLAGLTDAERDSVAELFAGLCPVPPRRRSGRRAPARHGEMDGRRLLREQIRLLGEPSAGRFRRRVSRPRRMLLLVDVSGSMVPYAPALLRLAHVWVRSQPRLTEVFTVGTRLTRITRALGDPDPVRALRSAGEQVPDWSGGTRLGEGLGAVLDRWGGHAMIRAATVVIFSDGFERGSGELLGEQMARLRRRAHHVIWVNPHRGREGFRPVQSGMRAALPYCDELVAGHSMAAFVALLTRVAQS